MFSWYCGFQNGEKSLDVCQMKNEPGFCPAAQEEEVEDISNYQKEAMMMSL